MSKAAIMLVGTGMIGSVQATLTEFQESGLSQKQVQITMSSGHRIRVVEGMLAFANAECVRPGDIIEFEFQDIAKGSYKAGKDTERERDVQTLDFVGIGELKVSEIGAFSDVADENLIAAGRQPLEYKSRTVAARDTQAKPPTAPKGDENKTVTEESPFEEKGH